MGSKGKDPINFNRNKHDEAGEKGDEGTKATRHQGNGEAPAIEANVSMPLCLDASLPYLIVSKPDSFCIGSELLRMLFGSYYIANHAPTFWHVFAILPAGSQRQGKV